MAQLWDIFMANIVERIAEKLRRFILLHFQLITLRFYYWKDRNINFHDFWIFGPVGSLIYGFEYTKLLLKI